MAELILHLPGIERSAASRLPGNLTDALRKARYAEHGSARALESILGCGQIPAPAPLSALGSGIDADSRHWLRFDVVRMIPDLTAVWIDRPLRFDFDAPAYAVLGRELSELLRSEGLSELVHFSDGFGLVGLPAESGCRFTDLEAAQGGRLDEHLPKGRDAARWQRLITASQMLFHRYRALDRADQTGAGLWFWGEGAVDRSPPEAPKLDVIDAFGSAAQRGLASWLGANLQSGRPNRGDRWPERTLVSLPLEQADPGDGLRVLLEDWFQPAMSALREGRLRQLTVVGSRGVWRIGRMQRVAFWRRRIRGLQEGDGR